MRFLPNTSAKPRFRRPNPYDIAATGLAVWIPFLEPWPAEYLEGNPAAAVNAYSVVPSGRGELAGVFNGTSTYVDFPSTNQNKIDSQDCSILCWVYFNNVSSEQICMQKGSDLDNSVSYGFGLDFLNHAGGGLAMMQGNDYVAGTNVYPSANAWHYVAIFRHTAAATIEYWLDGVPLGSFAYSKNPVSTTKTLTLGTRGVATAGSGSGRGLYFSGMMSDVRIYTVAASPGHIWSGYDPSRRIKLRSDWNFTDSTTVPPLPQTVLPEVFGGPIPFGPFALRVYAAPPMVQAPAPPVPPALQFSGVWGVPAWGYFVFGVTQGAPEVTPSGPPLPEIFGGPLPFGPLAMRVYAAPPMVQGPIASPKDQALPPVVGGPVRGALWFHQQVSDQPANVKSTFTVPPVLVTPPNVRGGPVGGSPWFEQLIVDQQGNVQPPPPPPSNPPPSVRGGPVPFTPWNQRPVTEQFTPIPLPPAVPPAPGPFPSVQGGPVPFAPWQRGQVIVTEPTPGPTPTQPIPPLIVGVVPPLAPVPGNDQRLYRFTQKVADIVNSLVRQGQLVQTDPNDWSIIETTVLTFNGRTGVVTFLLTDLPPSGVTAGSYQLPFLSVDQYGRVTAVQSVIGASGVPLLGGSPPAFGTQNVQIDSRVGIIQNDGSFLTGTTATLNIGSSDAHQLTINGTVTLALSNVGNVRIFTIELIQGAGGSATVNWFSTIKWSGGTAPTLTTTAGKTDVFTFINQGGGTYLGFVAGLNC